MTTREMIEVMEAYENGAEIECKYKYIKNYNWEIVEHPAWNWTEAIYRVKQEPKTKILKKWMSRSDKNSYWWIADFIMTEDEAKIYFESSYEYKPTGREWEVEV
jgi:hypothetical protein